MTTLDHVCINVAADGSKCSPFANAKIRLRCAAIRAFGLATVTGGGARRITGGPVIRRSNVKYDAWLSRTSMKRRQTAVPRRVTDSLRAEATPRSLTLTLRSFGSYELGGIVTIWKVD